MKQVQGQNSGLSERDYQDELSDRLRQLHKDHYLSTPQLDEDYWNFMQMAWELIGCRTMQQAYIRTEFLFRQENYN